MASEIMKPLGIFSILYLVSNLLCLVNAIPQVPCYFIFGDSLVDGGNNNALPTVAKANYPPYGIDFPAGPTGRFSNGRNLADVVTERLGFNTFIPPFATVTGSQILNGVNYASGASGIRDETGSATGTVIPLTTQLQNHLSIVRQIALSMGNNDSSTTEYLGKCIYSVDTGGNDYILNYFIAMSNTSREYTPEQYARVLIDQYSQQLRILYKSGARKIVLFGLGPLGFIPFELAMCARKGSLCQAKVNLAIRIFNRRLKLFVVDLNRTLPSAKFIYIDYYGIFESYALLSPPGSLITNSTCCLLSPSGITCIPSSTPCTNRNQYVFWDGVHTTEATNLVLGGRAYNAKFPTDAFPYDINRLAQLP